MKKTISIIMSLALVLALTAGCGSISGGVSDADAGRDGSGTGDSGRTGDSGGSGSADLSKDSASPAGSPMPSAAPAAPGEYAPSGGYEGESYLMVEDALGGALELAPAAEPAERTSSGEPTESEPTWDDTPEQIENIYIRPGMLTAGEWNDNKYHDFISNLAQTHDDFRTFENMWQFNLQNQIKVTITDNGDPVNNAVVELLDARMNAFYVARTNNQGVAYLFINLRHMGQNAAAYIRATKGSIATVEFDPATRGYELSISDEYAPKSLDLMFVIDTTGSMSDELEFLKVELEDIVHRVSADNANMRIRLSTNVYRDTYDDYIVRSTPFETNIGNQIEFLRKQRADGGGDWEEAVEVALADALENHDWNDDATAKLLFLVLDAPPHNTAAIRDEMHRLAALASEMGVRIIPIASSGIDKVTEFLLRALSMSTGGTYVFLTEHSGIGDAKIAPTIGFYEVELLNDLIVRVINNYLD